MVLLGANDGAGNLLECVLGPYTSDLFGDWRLPVGFDAEGAAECALGPYTSDLFGDWRLPVGFDAEGAARVVQHVGRLLDGKTASRPAELVKDGDLILLVEKMIHLRELDTVRISKVEGHADEALVRAWGARDLDRLGNNGREEGMRLLILVGGGCLGGLLTLGVIILGFVLVGARLFSVCIGF